MSRRYGGTFRKPTLHSDQLGNDLSLPPLPPSTNGSTLPPGKADPMETPRNGFPPSSQSLKEPNGRQKDPNSTLGDTIDETEYLATDGNGVVAGFHQLLEQIPGLREATSRLEMNNKSLEDEKMQLSKELTELGREKTKLKGEKERLEEDKAKLESDKAKLQNEKKGLEGDKAKLENDKAKLQDEKRGLETQKAKLQGDLNELREESRNLEVRNKQLQVDNVKLNDEIEKATQRLKSINDRLRTLFGVLKRRNKSYET